MPLLTRLNITNCIVIGDARRLEKGREPVRNIRGLSVELEMVNEERYDADKVCKYLYRLNQQGLKKVEEELLNDIRDILLVKENELVKYSHD